MRRALVLLLAVAACGDDDVDEPGWRVVDDDALRGIAVGSAAGIAEQIWVRGLTVDGESAQARFDGARWERLDADLMVPELATSIRDFWAVADGVLWRSDDAVSWDPVEVEGLEVRSVHGTGPEAVWIVTSVGRVFLFDGIDWTERPELDLREEEAVTGGCSRGAEDVWLTGVFIYNAIVWHWDGATWSGASDGLADTCDGAVEVTCSATDLWARVDPYEEGHALYRWVEDAWVPITFATQTYDEYRYTSSAGPGTAWVLGHECDDYGCDAPRSQIWYVENDRATPTLSADRAANTFAAVWTTASGRTFAFGHGVVLEHVDR